MRDAALNAYPLEEFDKLSITGKWLFLPKIIGSASFDPGREPFQSFRALARTRNSLVHYKAKRERWKGYEVPGFLDQLALTKGDAEKSVHTAEAMIIRLATLLGEGTPDWTKHSDKWVNVFSMALGVHS